MISVSCVISLGPKWGSGVLWAARAAAEADLHGGPRRRAAFRPKQGIRFMTAMPKGPGGHADDHRGLGLTREAAQVVGGEVRAAGTGGARGEGCCRGPPGF
jgi:hypothetical protein